MMHALGVRAYPKTLLVITHVINVEVTSRQSAMMIDTSLIEKAARLVLRGEQVQSADLSIAIVDDQMIQQLNRQYLEHDYPTDVLSFPLDRQATCVEGEIIVSAQTAIRESSQYGWSAEKELLLYVVHGALHLLGYDDQSADQSQMMRAKEREYLAQLSDPAPDP
jgi:probable rRNA maturation factor